jgi:2-hydroxy-6-oxonona-2,4-dienedioate hydrolase
MNALPKSAIPTGELVREEAHDQMGLIHAPGRHRWARVLVTAGAAFALGIAAFYLAYRRDLTEMNLRLIEGSRIAQTSHGPVEYAVRGQGAPVLVIHGAGGGYDQGLRIAEAFGGEGFRWISPSRFGYLRSPLPADASTAAQADALAELLDALGVDQVAIVAHSGGVPPALQFAERYPGRTTAVVLLSGAPYTPLGSQEKLPVPIWVYQALFSSDFPFWLMHKVAPGSLDGIFDVTPELRARLGPEEVQMVAGTVEGFLPVTKRLDGVRNEGAAIDPVASYHLDEITAPTLVIHAQDDGINPFSIGEYTAARIPGARFVPLNSGGHLLLGHHMEIRTEVTSFLHRPGR